MDNNYYYNHIQYPKNNNRSHNRPGMDEAQYKTTAVSSYPQITLKPLPPGYGYYWAPVWKPVVANVPENYARLGNQTVVIEKTVKSQTPVRPGEKVQYQLQYRAVILFLRNFAQQDGSMRPNQPHHEPQPEGDGLNNSYIWLFDYDRSEDEWIKMFTKNCVENGNRNPHQA